MRFKIREEYNRDACFFDPTIVMPRTERDASDFGQNIECDASPTNRDATSFSYHSWISVFFSVHQIIRCDALVCCNLFRDA